jgi:hypothetical protein
MSCTHRDPGLSGQSSRGPLLFLYPRETQRKIPILYNCIHSIFAMCVCVPLTLCNRRIMRSTWFTYSPEWQRAGPTLSGFVSGPADDVDPVGLCWHVWGKRVSPLAKNKKKILEEKRNTATVLVANSYLAVTLFHDYLQKSDPAELLRQRRDLPRNPFFFWLPRSLFFLTRRKGQSNQHWVSKNLPDD